MFRYMSRKNLEYYIREAKRIIEGNGAFKNLPYEEQKKYIQLGTNRSALTGWNWNAYFDTASKTLVIDGYRNFPGGKMLKDFDEEFDGRSNMILTRKEK